MLYGCVKDSFSDSSPFKELQTWQYFFCLQIRLLNNTPLVEYSCIVAFDATDILYRSSLEQFISDVCR